MELSLVENEQDKWTKVEIQTADHATNLYRLNRKYMKQNRKQS